MPVATVRVHQAFREAARAAARGACLAVCGTLAVAVAGAGCAAAVGVALPAAAGAGNLAYSEYSAGEYVLTLDAGRAECAQAVLHTCKAFGLAVSSWRDRPEGIEVTAHNARGDRFRLLVSEVAPDRTAVYIRAGFWGDDLCSRQLAAQICEALQGLRRTAHPGGGVPPR